MLYGKYAETRRSLDYSFHKVYPEERQILQDSIIDYFLDEKPCFTDCNPKLVLAAGAMGSGKSHVMKNMLKIEYEMYVIADVDRIKHHIPEMRRLLETDPDNAGKIMHSEACTIHEIIFRQAVIDRRNLIIDGSLRNGEFFNGYLSNLKKNSTYEVTIVHVVASLKTCLRRAEKRSKETGRIVPQSSISLSIEECPKSVERLRKIVDIVLTVYNDKDDGEC